MIAICEFSRSEWKVIHDEHSNKAKKCSSYSSDHDRTINRCDVLSEIQTQSDKIPVINGITTSRNRSQKIQSRIKKFKFWGSVRIIFLKWKMKKISLEVNRKVNIIILSDRHACGVAGRLKVTLKDNIEVIGYTKPNCNVKVQLMKILLIYQRMMYTSYADQMIYVITTQIGG